MENEKNVRKIALITYNRVGDGQYDEVIKKDGLEVYVVQNGHKSKWGVDGNLPLDERRTVRERIAKRAMDGASTLSLEDMDMIYLYIGTNGAESVIQDTEKIPSQKITYVLCDCNLSKKKEIIRAFGHSESKIIVSECGGRDTLEKILKSYLN